jgi:hypothetical protein
MSHVRLLHRDLRVDGLVGVPDSSMDGCLCDPPYGFRPDGRALTWEDSPTGSGFMGKKWDSAVPGVTFWREVLRVLKPGASVLAFGGTRTYHRLACAIEDAGFEIRDSVLCPGAAWIHGQGFPKSRDISAAIDKSAGLKREAVGTRVYAGGHVQRSSDQHLAPPIGTFARAKDPRAVTQPSSPEALIWDGYGTALKPAWEPVVWGMKPTEETFADNALGHGVAGINVQGARIGSDLRTNGPGSATSASRKSRVEAGYRSDSGRGPGSPGGEAVGRWPANVILCHLPECEEAGIHEIASNSHHPAKRSGGSDHLPGHHGQADLEERRPGIETVETWNCAPGCPVAELDRQSGKLTSGFMEAGTQREGIGWRGGLGATVRNDTHADTGGATRFFYCAKVSPAERNGSKHPTLKPIDLCRYLATLILPPARAGEPRRLLVPFAGEGSEIIGALLAGWEDVTGLEGNADYLQNGAARIKAVAPLLYSVESEA